MKRILHHTINLLLAIMLLNTGLAQVVDAGIDQEICRGDTVILGDQGCGGCCYSWEPTEGLSNPNTLSPKAFPSQTTTYTLTATLPDLSELLMDEVEVEVITIDIMSVSDADEPQFFAVTPGDNQFLILKDTATVLIDNIYSHGTGEPNCTVLWTVKGENIDTSGNFNTGNPEVEITIPLNKETGTFVVSAGFDADGNGVLDEQKERVHDLDVILGKTQLIFTDITGVEGVDDGLGVADITRIPIDEQPDGIACDGLENVDGGAALLVRLVTSSEEYDRLNENGVTVEFGQIISEAFAPLKADKSDGRFIEMGDAESNISGLGIAVEGEEHLPGIFVYAAQVYIPPIDFNINDDEDTRKQRPVSLAAELDEGGDKNSIEKDIELVRPLLIGVHGVNAKYESTFTDAGWDDDMADLGFVTDGLDHTQDLQGNGHVVDAAEEIGDGIKDKLQDFRNGKYLDGLKIATQKCDLVAHSYGGIVCRWYTEIEDQYDEVLNVRKFITLASPHRGVPAANVTAEIYKNKTLFNAGSVVPTIALSRLLQTGISQYISFSPIGLAVGLLRTGVESFQTSAQLGAFLEFVNAETAFKGPGEFLEGLRMRWHENGAPPDVNGSNEEAIVQSVQVTSFNSEVINTLNDPPFDDEIAYGSIIGDRHEITIPAVEQLEDALPPVGPTAGLKALLAFATQSNASFIVEPLDPHQTGVTGDLITFKKSYLPWLTALESDDGLGDGIIPLYSQKLPVKSEVFDLAHTFYTGDADVQDQVRKWLNGPLDLGKDQRAGFLSETQAIPNYQSRLNIFKGSELQANETSLFAGVYPNAIVQVKLTGEELDFDEDGEPVIPSTGGLAEITCTGMVADAGRQLQVVYDGAFIFDVDLTDPVSVPYSGSGELETFNIHAGYIGRDRQGNLVGPAGEEKEVFDNTYEVGYEISGSDYFGFKGQSPGTRIHVESPGGTPQLFLPTIEGPTTVGPTPQIFTARGGYEVEKAPGETQEFRLLIRCDDDLDILIDTMVQVVVQPNTFPGVLMPYEFQFELFENIDNELAGVHGTSGAPSCPVRQQMVFGAIGGTDEPFSSPLTVTVGQP